MGNNTQSRKWALVINNPLEAGLDHSAITKILQKFAPAYYCMADEIATTGTYHTHIFLYAPSPIRFTTIKNRFPRRTLRRHMGAPGTIGHISAKKGSGRTRTKRKPLFPALFRNGVTSRRNRRNRPRRCSGLSRISGRVCLPRKSLTIRQIWLFGCGTLTCSGRP